MRIAPNFRRMTGGFGDSEKEAKCILIDLGLRLYISVHTTDKETKRSEEDRIMARESKIM
jgi:hypothetical protein